MSGQPRGCALPWRSLSKVPRSFCPLRCGWRWFGAMRAGARITLAAAGRPACAPALLGRDQRRPVRPPGRSLLGSATRASSARHGPGRAVRVVGDRDRGWGHLRGRGAGCGRLPSMQRHRPLGRTCARANARPLPARQSCWRCTLSARSMATGRSARRWWRALRINCARLFHRRARSAPTTRPWRRRQFLARAAT